MELSTVGGFGVYVHPGGSAGARIANGSVWKHS